MKRPTAAAVGITAGIALLSFLAGLVVAAVVIVVEP